MNTITDENIREIFKSHKVNLSTPDINQAIYDAARDLIALAQEVRPLPFVKEDGVYTLRTVFGQYHIARQDDVTWFFKFDNNDFPYEHFVMRELGSEQSAIAAAQADFNRRVLANLVHGDAE
jgi:hypothetical protein